MIEVLKKALEALYPISHNSTDDYRGQADKAITSLRQAIAEFDSHTLYREGYVNGYAFGEAAGRKAVAEKQDGACQHCAGKGCVACDAREQEPVAWRLNGESSLGHGKVFGDWKSGNPPADVADLASVDKNWSLEFAHTTPSAQPAKPIPCANHCEATAFEIVIKNLQGEIERLKASRREWVGLTKEDKDLIEDLCKMMIGDAVFSTIDAILKGKNT